MDLVVVAFDPHDPLTVDPVRCDEPFPHDTFTLAMLDDGGALRPIHRFDAAYSLLWVGALDITGDGASELVIQHAEGRGSNATRFILTILRFDGQRPTTILNAPLDGWVPVLLDDGGVMPIGRWSRTWRFIERLEGGYVLEMLAAPPAEPCTNVHREGDLFALQARRAVYAFDHDTGCLVIHELDLQPLNWWVKQSLD